MIVPADNARASCAVKAHRDARHRAPRPVASELRVQISAPSEATRSAADIISAALLANTQMDMYIFLLDRINDSLCSLAQTRAWEQFMFDSERIDLSDEELRRLSEE